MKEKVISAIKVVLMLGVCMISITFLYILECNTNTSPPDITHSEDTIALQPSFYDKSAKEGLREALEFYDIQHPDVVYAQAILETGHFKSTGCLEYNNLFGLHSGTKHCRFNHWTDGVIAYKEWIQRRYKPPEDYYKFLSRIHYAEDSTYISKLKQIVRKENDKRRYAKGDTVSQRK